MRRHRGLGTPKKRTPEEIRENIRRAELRPIERLIEDLRKREHGPHGWATPHDIADALEVLKIFLDTQADEMV